MSPIGGVGVNIAVQDAVAAANRLAAPLKAGTASDDDLRAIQERRTFPVRFTQGIQLTMQNRLVRPMLAGKDRPKPPALFRLLAMIPVLQRIPGRLCWLSVCAPSMCRHRKCSPSSNPLSANALPRSKTARS